MEFDENDAIKYIRDHAPVGQYDDDELLNVIDMIYDFYESNGMLDIDLNDDDDDDDVSEEEIVGYVVRMLKKDKEAKLAADDVPAVVSAYLEYETTLDEE